MSSSGGLSPRSAHSGKSGRSKRSKRSGKSSRSGRSSHEPDPTIFNHPLYRPAYIPYFEPRVAKMPTVVQILESKQRVHYKPPSEHLYESQKRKPFSNPLTLDMPLLDLGMEPLIKIVTEMHRLSNDNTHYYFDQNASRAAGLPTYCDYLQGKPVVKKDPFAMFTHVASPHNETATKPRRLNMRM